MKNAITVLLLLLATSGVASAGTYEWNNISVIRSPDGRPCLFFQMKGVSNVDSTGNAWFVVKQSHVGYKEISSMIMAAKITGIRSSQRIFLEISFKKCRKLILPDLTNLKNLYQYRHQVTLKWFETY